jgi:hypothetical protein
VAQQTLDFVISQQVTGQAEVAKLIKQVGALDAEMQKLRAATAAMGGGFNQAAGAIRGNTNLLDAQSKALRNSRQGMQQVGMQINDFATSVSTGASPIQAFNQQIGQLGYAMSMMQGTAGAVGRFLAGPWSIAVIGAAMGLGYLWENIKGTSRSIGDMVAQKQKDYYASIQNERAEAAYGRTLEGVTAAIQANQQSLDALNGKRRSAAQLALDEARANMANAAALQIETSQRLIQARARVSAALNGPSAMAIAGPEGAALAGGELSRREKAVEDLGKAFMQNAQNLNNASKALRDAERTIGKDSGGAAGSLASVGASAGKAISPMQQFLDSINRTDERLKLARQAFEENKITVRQYREEFERAAKARFPKVPEKLIKVLQDAGQPFALPRINANVQTPEALQKIIDQNAAIVQSFDAVGNSVANAFKGMITGAQGFGDAMKGIIQSVIDELFRLFVVQQIVGFVSKSLSAATGVPLPGRALGGSVAQNKPYIVGERGPELFVPGKSGTVIPTQNSRGGGGGATINVSVDARGSTDPEAVRQQVERGILEAAPSIVAAAEQRTISTLRRPRLAGVL